MVKHEGCKIVLTLFSKKRRQHKKALYYGSNWKKEGRPRATQIKQVGAPIKEICLRTDDLNLKKWWQVFGEQK